MKLKLVAAISALAIPALAHAEQSGPQPAVPKPTEADAQKVVQIITSDKVAQNSAAWTSSTSGGRRRAHSCERSSDL